MTQTAKGNFSAVQHSPALSSLKIKTINFNLFVERKCDSTTKKGTTKEVFNDSDDTKVINE